MATRLVACPHCGTMIEWIPQNPFRPFCSERCKMIDLGAWATERYRVPVTETDESDEVQSDDEGDPSLRPN